MLNNVDSASGVLVSTGDNSYAISEKFELAENLSVGNTADLFESEYALLSGNRISIVVNGEYVKTTIVEENIVSEGPFQYDTSAITNGAIPLEVYFTGDLRIEIIDISANLEFTNISTATVADILTVDRVIISEDNFIIATSDDKIHKISYTDISFPEAISGIRYIRDHMNGSTANVGNHWVEIQALEVTSGTNRALSSNGATISGSVPENTSYPYSRIIDGSTNSSVYAATSINEHVYVTIDLGAVYDIETLKVWHYNLDSRTYYETKTEVSMDGITWFVMYDSAVSGTYTETSAGKTIPVVDGPSIGGGSVVDTTTITRGEVPSKAYCANVAIAFNGIVAADNTARYSIIESSENISAVVKKHNVVSYTDGIESRIDFTSIGDKMIGMNYYASLLVNDRYIAPEFKFLAVTSIKTSQSIIFEMK